MATTVFYAWQSDREGEVCHYLIRDAANDAIQRLKEAGTKTDAEGIHARLLPTPDLNGKLIKVTKAST